MGLKYVEADEFEKRKEEKWPKQKAKAVKDDKKEDNNDWRCGGHGNDNEQYDGKWIEVVKGSTTKIIKAEAKDNTFILLADDHGPRKTITTNPDTAIPIERTYTISERSHNNMEKQDRKLKQRMHRKQTLQRLALQDDHFLKESITTAEDERTAMAKADKMEVPANHHWQSTRPKQRKQETYGKHQATCTKHNVRIVNSIQAGSHATPNKQETSDVPRNTQQ